MTINELIAELESLTPDQKEAKAELWISFDQGRVNCEATSIDASCVDQVGKVYVQSLESERRKR